MAAAMDASDKKEMVIHPDHYNSGGIEVFDIIRAFNLGFFDGNAVKYILRAGKKSKDTRVEDLLKAMNYLHEVVVADLNLPADDDRRKKADTIIKAYVAFIKGDIK